MTYRERMRALREDMIKLCRFYGVSADYFIGISDERK